MPHRVQPLRGVRLEQDVRQAERGLGLPRRPRHPHGRKGIKSVKFCPVFREVLTMDIPENYTNEMLEFD